MRTVDFVTIAVTFPGRFCVTIPMMLVARHPVAAFLVMVYTIYSAFALLGPDPGFLLVIFLNLVWAFLVGRWLKRLMSTEVL